MFSHRRKGQANYAESGYSVTGLIKHRMCPNSFLKVCSVGFEDVIASVKCINKPKNMNMF